MINYKINNLIATFFNIGYAKYLPGSLASLLSGFCILVFLVKVNPSFILQVFILFLLILIALLSINQYQKISKKTDPREIVIDEIVGMYISLMFFNLIKGDLHNNFTILSEIDYFLLAFLFFRIFDGFKPSFLYRIQIQHSNSSILLDDVFAGLLTLILMLALALNNFV